MTLLPHPVNAKARQAMARRTSERVARGLRRRAASTAKRPRGESSRARAMELGDILAEFARGPVKLPPRMESVSR